MGTIDSAPVFLPWLREVCLKLLETLPQHCFSYLNASCSVLHCYNLMIVVDSHSAYCCALHVVSFRRWTQLPVYTEAFLPKHSLILTADFDCGFCEGLFQRSSDKWPIEIIVELSSCCQGNTSLLLLFMRSRDWLLTSSGEGRYQSLVHSWLHRASWNLEDLLNRIS